MPGVMTTVAGECPMGCGATLFLGEGGHVTCSLLGCPRPSAADELLHLDTEHAVVFDEEGWTVEHPARERVDGTMHLCPLHTWLRGISGPPVVPGRYRARRGGGSWIFTRLEERNGTAASGGDA